MELTGLYYKTLSRNEYNGYTSFLFTPTEICEFASEGLVLCSGTVGSYSYKTPLRLSGEWDGKSFCTDDAVILSSGKNATKLLLDLFFYDSSMKLTASEKKKIDTAADGDLLSFLQKKNVEYVLYEILSDVNKVNHIMEYSRLLIRQEELTKLCIECGLPIDRIQILVKNNETVESIKRNPYKALEKADIDVYTADQMAFRFNNIDPYDPMRLNGYLWDAVKISRTSGNSCTPVNDLLNIINRRLSKSPWPDAKISFSILNHLLMRQNNYLSLVEYNKTVYVYETRILTQENDIIKNMKRLQTSRTSVYPKFRISDIEEALGIQYRSGQKAVFKLLKTSGIKILTGPPGSGKTTVIKGLMLAYQKMYPNKKICLAATTGRASQVMAEACDFDAKTVHKMLNIQPYMSETISKDLNTPVEGDFIIVDEVSMIGLELFSLLLNAVNTGSILLLVGDKDQLQSVEYGNVLEDLIVSRNAEVYTLTEIMRQSGTICENAQRINRNHVQLKEDQTFHIFDCDSPEEALQQFSETYNRQDDQVLSTVKKGALGIYELNQYIINKISNKKNRFQYGKTEYFEGCRVIMNKTCYEKGYFNGSIGTIAKIMDDNIFVDFRDNVLCLSKSDLHNMYPAYAITAHKSQGGEFGAVHIFLPDHPSNMLTKRILYTAVTRARNSVYIYSIHGSHKTAILNTKEQRKISILSPRIRAF